MPGMRLSSLQRLSLLPGKLRERGPRWFVARAIDIVVQWVVRSILRSSIVGRIVLLWSARQTSKATLFVFYDIQSMPISFDIAWFLVCADLRRRKSGLKAMHCVFVPLKEDAVRDYPPGYNEAVDAVSRAWRFNNVCADMTTLMPSLSGYTVASNRALAGGIEIYGAKRWPSAAVAPLSLTDIYRETIAGLNTAGPDWGLRAPEQGMRYVRSWLKRHARGRRPIVVTMRAYPVDPERNSAIDEWLTFLNGLDESQYFPVIIPDTDSAFDLDATRLGKVAVFSDAAWNLGLRMALYEMAFLNMLVNCGPAALCMLSSRCRYLLFKITVPGVHLASDATLRNMGFEPGNTPSFAAPLQKWVWEDDKAEILRREFGTMVSAIEQSEIGQQN